MKRLFQRGQVNVLYVALVILVIVVIVILVEAHPL